jgi:hypothetical protein
MALPTKPPTHGFDWGVVCSVRANGLASARRSIMATFIVLGNWTEQGVKNYADAPTDELMAAG